MVFNKRLTAPTSATKWYGTNNPFNTKGLSMFKKHPTNLGNCTHYAYGRMSELMSKKCGLPTGNAGTWYNKTKFEKGKTPRLGAIIEYKHTTKSGGHVAVVEEIKSNGDLVLSMSGYNSFLFTTREVKKSKNYCYNDYALVGFIYCPVDFSNKKHYSGTYPSLPSRGYFKKGDKGEQAKNLQKLLNWLNNSKLTVDGIIGDKTINGVKLFQKNNSLSQDGLFGKNCLNKAKDTTK